MAVAPMPRRSGDATRSERALLAALGLPHDANAQDIQVAHDRLVEYLERAPRALHAWAERGIAAADEAYALLSDPAASHGDDQVPASGGRTDRSARAYGSGPGTPDGTGRRPAAPASRNLSPVADDADDEEYFEELELEPQVSQRSRQVARRRTRRDAQVAASAPPGRRTGIHRFGRLAAVAAGAVAVAAITIGVYSMGASSVPGFTGSPAPEAAASPALDEAQVAALMQKISANPGDIASLQGLCDLFFKAGDYATAGDWARKVLAVDPKNLTALLAAGAAAFNLGDSSGAEKEWRAVLAIDDRNLEAHYDLGFMYLSKEPPDVANVRLEWDKVIAIDPNSDVAKTVATHLQSLTGSPAPGAGGTPAASPGASPASSPAPPAAESPAGPAQTAPAPSPAAS